MSTNFRSKSYKQTSVNDKIVDRSGYDIKYDDEGAVIDTLKNEDMYRVKMDNDEFLNLMKRYYKSNRSGSRSIRDTLMKDFDIDKTGLVGDLFRDKDYSRSLMSPMFSDHDDSTSYRDYDKGANVTKKRKRRRRKKNGNDETHTAKKKRKSKK